MATVREEKKKEREDQRRKRERRKKMQARKGEKVAIQCFFSKDLGQQVEK